LTELFGLGKRPTRFNRVMEKVFRQWYLAQASKTGIDPDPDNPLHYYDNRAAFQAGVGPDPVTNHWPSKFKEPFHPNRFVNGVDTTKE